MTAGKFRFRSLQRRKRLGLALLLAAVLLEIACLTLRVVPKLDDSLSGTPETMQGFANVMARQIAATGNYQNPVVVIRDEHLTCKGVRQSSSLDYEEAFYVIEYSQQSRSLCIIVYGTLPPGANHASAITLYPGMGRSFGAPFTSAVTAFPLGHQLMLLSPQYLALFDWRTKVSPTTSLADAVKAERMRNISPEATLTDTTINLLQVRAEVAQKHERVNRWLLWIMVVIAGMIAMFLAIFVFIYRAARQTFRGYGYELSLREFIFEDMVAIGSIAENERQRYHQQLLAQRRAESFERTEKEHLQQRLRAMLEIVNDESERLRIQQSLDQASLDEMEALLQQLQPQAAQKTPEERLRLLLETLKEYSNQTEFQECEQIALELLRREGFRQARQAVTVMHEHFRERSRREAELEQQPAPDKQ